MIYVKIYSRMWHFCDSHYHIGLFKGPIFEKSSVDYELTRAGSSEILGFKIFLGYLLDYKTGKCNKKGYVIDGLGSRIQYMPKMWYFCLFSPIWPPVGVGGRESAKFTFSIFLVPTWWDLTIKQKIELRSQKSCLFDTHGHPRYIYI